MDNKKFRRKIRRKNILKNVNRLNQFGKLHAAPPLVCYLIMLIARSNSVFGENYTQECQQQPSVKSVQTAYLKAMR